MELRPYQQQAFNAIMDAMRTEQFILCQAATGAGKTILFSAIIRHCMEQYKMRIGILAHREILVRQAQDKLLKVWPDGKDKIGIACASASHDVQLFRPVLIGSPQTLANRLDALPPLHLLIIDECHRLPPRNKESQYGDLLQALLAKYPKLRVLGVTATPYRLNHGYVYGKKCRPKSENWFGRMAYGISIETLQEQGFLVPLRAKQAENIEQELAAVSTSAGDFNVAELSAVMSRQVHIQSAVDKYLEYGEGRQHVVAFCVTIEHAEVLREAFEESGIPAAVIHSKMPREERENAMSAFEEGRVTVICNVGVLTEGWDCTAVDCILFCRPTMSPALYVQMVGRGLRLHPGKKDCLLLDLSGNCLRHGDVNDPFVKIPGTPAGKKEKKEYRECPNCGELFKYSQPECPACGWQPERQALEDAADPGEMVDVQWGDGPFDADVLRWSMYDYTSRAGNRFARLDMVCSIPEAGRLPKTVSSFLDFDGGVSGYMQDKAIRVWEKLSRDGDNWPESVEEALSRSDEIQMPPLVRVKRNKDGYFNVVKWGA